MSAVNYAAKRSQTNGHVANERYTVELPVMDINAEVQDVKDIDRSPGGGIETSFQRSDTQWTIKFGPLSGSDLKLAREVLDSILTGETWRIWPLDSSPVPLVLKCTGSSYSETPLVLAGSESADVWTATVTALEAVPYDPSGALPPASIADFGNGGDTIDIYDPAIGSSDGAIDEPGIVSAAQLPSTILVSLSKHSAAYNNPMGVGVRINTTTLDPIAVEQSPGGSPVYTQTPDITGYGWNIGTSAPSAYQWRVTPISGDTLNIYGDSGYDASGVWRDVGSDPTDFGFAVPGLTVQTLEGYFSLEIRDAATTAILATSTVHLYCSKLA